MWARRVAAVHTRNEPEKVMRRERLEDGACRIGMRRSSKGGQRRGCRGTCASCRCWGLLGRALRGRVGEGRQEAEAFIDRFLVARRLPEVRHRDLRADVVGALAAGGLWAKDGWLRFGPDSGRLCFAQGNG